MARAEIVTDSTSHEKKVILHPRMLPAQVIADPALTVSLPKALTAGTGLDAFAHCLEAYSSPHFHPMSQGIALEGMRLVKDYLPRAFADGADLEARAQMMAAASMGAVAFQKGLGAIHALSHPIGALSNTHHGTRERGLHARGAEIQPPRDRDEDRAGRQLSRHSREFQRLLRLRFQELNASLGIPLTLTALGVTNPDLDALTRAALRDPSVGGNPVEMTYDNTRALLEALL